MPDERDGCCFPIPPSRCLSWDLLYFHRSVPLCAHDRVSDLSTVAAARRVVTPRVSWPALFIRAFALIAASEPQLRQTWYRWPWAALYQHPSSVAALTVQRTVDDAAWLFWGHVRNAESRSLTEIQQQIEVWQNGDPRVVFKKQWQMAHLIMPLRRLIWWWNLNVETRKRATRVGTFFLSTLSGRGAEIQLPPSVHTCCLTYGPICDTGHSRVTLAYDHRVMDGAFVADVLQKLEVTLNTQIVEELRNISSDARPSGEV